MLVTCFPNILNDILKYFWKTFSRPYKPILIQGMFLNSVSMTSAHSQNKFIYISHLLRIQIITNNNLFLLSKFFLYVTFCYDFGLFPSWKPIFKSIFFVHMYVFNCIWFSILNKSGL